MDKINRLQIWIIAVVLSAISAAVIWFALISPMNDRMAAATTKYDQAHAIAITRSQKEKDLRNAKLEVAQAQADWNRYDRQLMPNIDLRNLYTAMRQLWKEQITVLGPRVKNYLRADKKVQISENIALPAPPTDPNAVNQKVFVYDLGTVSVQGTFEDVLNHVARWNKFDRLVLADGLTLAGNSPQLVGTYSLRVFEFPHYADQPGPNYPAAAPSTGGGGFSGGGFGGGSGGPGFSGRSGPSGVSGAPAGFGSSSGGLSPSGGASAAPMQ